MKPALLLIVAGLAGCAAMKPGLGFDEVKQSVAERTGLKVHWDSGSSEDAAVRDAVRSLLERELSADEAVQIALLNNRDLQATYEELNLAQAELVQAGLLKNPVFSGEVRWATDGGGTGVVLDLSQDFLSLLFVPLHQGRAEAAFEAAKLRVTGEVLDLAAQVRRAFYELQADQQLLEMRRTVVDATGASYELAKRIRAAGNNRDLDVSNERVLYEQSKLDLAAAEGAAARHREDLNELMGLWGDQTRWRLGDRLPAIDQQPAAESLESQAVERSLELGVARREVEIAARTLGIARPLAALGGAEVGVAAEREIDGPWSVGPSVSLPVPLFDQGQGAIGSAQARYRQATERYVASAVRVRARVRAAYAATGAARDRAAYYERVLLPLRQTIVDQTQLQYNAMQVSAFQLLQAKRDQIDSGAEYVASLREYWLARSDFDEILSGRLPSAERGLSSIPSGTPAMAGVGGHR